MDNKFDIMLNKIIKLLLISVICITLIIGTIFIFPPSFALDTDDFEVIYNSGTPSTSTYLENISAIKYPSKYATVYKTFNSDTEPVYFFLYGASVNNYQGSYCFITLADLTNYPDGTLSWFNKPNGGTGISKYSMTGATKFGDNRFRYDSGSISYSGENMQEIYCPVFSTLQEGLNAFIDWYDNPSGTFASFPQVNSNTNIDYSIIAAQGSLIYTGINTYSFLGQYESSSAPISQYCYVQTGENAYTAVVFSSVPLTVYKAFINGQTYSYSVCEQYDEGKYCYSFNQFSTLDDVSPLVPFTSLTDAKNAFMGASSGSGSASGVVSAGALTYQVPAGNVLYVRVRPGSIASVTADMPVISSTTSPYWLESQINTMWASGVPSLPSSNTVFPLSNMTRINFGLNPSVGTDGYGRSFSAYASHAPFNGGWFVVYNPAYTKTIIPGRTDLMSINPTVTVKCQFALEYYMYPLSETLTVDGGTSSNSTGYTDSWSGQYDPDNDNFEDTSTITNETPTSGGEQAPTINQNNMDIGGYVQEIKKTLDNFVDTLSQLLTAPIAHIQKLITYASNFMASIAQFFTWLPEPIYTVIVAALVVAVVIGILKLLF